MTRQEAAECVSTLCDLFPHAEMTEAELDLFRRQLLPYQKVAAIEAIEQHRMHARFNRPQFEAVFSQLRAAAARSKQGGPAECCSSFADMIRQQRNGRADGMHDFEVLLRYFRQQWLSLALYRDTYRETIRRKCVRQLIAHGMVEGDGLEPEHYVFAERCGDVPFYEAADFDAVVRDVIANAPRFVEEQTQKPTAAA